MADSKLIRREVSPEMIEAAMKAFAADERLGGAELAVIRQQLPAALMAAFGEAWTMRQQTSTDGDDCVSRTYLSEADAALARNP